MKAERIIEFTEHIFKEAEVNNCPFMRKWFVVMSENIFDTSPAIPSSKDPYTLRKKRFYALYLVINPKFSKKRFGEAFEIAYGTARNWVKDEKVTDAAASFAHDFIDAYVAKFKKIVYAPQGEMSLADYIEKKEHAIDKLIAETVFYNNHYLAELLIKVIVHIGANAAENVNSSEENNFSLLLATARFFKILASFHGLDSSESLGKYTKIEQDLYSAKFIAVKNLILMGETEFALESIDALEKQFSGLLNSRKFLEIEILKTRKKNEKK